MEAAGDCKWKQNSPLRAVEKGSRSEGQPGHHCQAWYLDTDFKFLFKDNYANIFTTEVEPKLKGKGFSARDRRVLVTHIVAKAHSLTISAGNAKRHEVFKKMGYLRYQTSSCGFCPLTFLFQCLRWSRMFSKWQLQGLRQCLNLILSATCQQQSAKLPSLPISACN